MRFVPWSAFRVVAGLGILAVLLVFSINIAVGSLAAVPGEFEVRRLLAQDSKTDGRSAGIVVETPFWQLDWWWEGHSRLFPLLFRTRRSGVGDTVAHPAHCHCEEVHRNKLIRSFDREIAVLRLVAKGKTNKEIARELSVTERTVEFHLGNVHGKLGVASRVEAAVWAREHGLDT